MRGCDDLTELFKTAVICAVIFVNGATDAPNSISGAVASGALKYRGACIVCAVFNFIGLALSYAFLPAVARTVSELSAADSTVPLLTVVIFASIAWALGVPTSESHALLAAMGGVSLYTFGTTGGKFIDVCIKSFASCAAGFAAGGALTVFTYSLFSRRRRVRKSFQIFSAALSSACHGMQDGQKFVCLLVPSAVGAKLPMSAVILCAAVMAAGCLTGGRKITETVGSGMISGDISTLNAVSDLGAVACTLASSVFGIPISTTYMKTCSLLGAASAKKAPVIKPIVLKFILTWVLTYPACMGIAYVLSAISHAAF